MFKLFFHKILKGFRVSASKGLTLSDLDANEDIEMPATVLDDVEGGHFTVFAVQGIEKQRFVVKLDNLGNPAFLSLLEQAREEYGFEQQGALTLPCRPQQLQQILEDNDQRTAANDMWAACGSSLIQGF